MIVRPAFQGFIKPASAGGAASRSIIFDATDDSAFRTIPNASPFNAVGDFRVEFRLHNYLTSATYTIWQCEHYVLYFNFGTGNLAFTDRASADGPLISISSRTDITVRLRRVSSTGEMSLEVWDTPDTNRGGQTTTVSTTGTKNWSTITSYKFSVGAVIEADNSIYSRMNGRLAWLRFFTTSGSYNTTAPAAGGSGDLLSYEFTDNGDDASANAQHLTLLGTPVYADTP